jgi:hypothetical protein
MLLDPQTDPDEMKNLADDPQYAPVRAELSARVRAYTAGDYAAAGVPPRD